MLREEGNEAADRKPYPFKTSGTGSNPAGNRSNQVSYGYYNIRRECSKAQMCLQKILHIISSIPRQESSSLDSQNGKLELDGNVDFNLRLGATVIEEDRESASVVENGGGGNCLLYAAVEDGDSAAEKSSEGECECEVFTEKILEHSEIKKSHLENRIDESEVKETIEKEKEKLVRNSAETAPHEEMKLKSGGDGDCLSLLIEAARLILGESTNKEEEFERERENKETRETGKAVCRSNSSGSKRKIEGNWMVMNLVSDIEDRSPVVRSKRGRSQVLPCRYKDSVIEQWRSQSLSGKISRKQRRSRN